MGDENKVMDDESFSFFINNIRILKTCKFK